MNHKKIVNYSCFIGIGLVWFSIISCIYLDAVVGVEKVREYVNQPDIIELGYLAEQQLIINQARINNMFIEIQRLRQEDSKLLKAVLEENGYFLKKGEGCDYDLEKRRFKFYDAKLEEK